MKEANSVGEEAGHCVLSSSDLSKEMISVFVPLRCWSARNSPYATTGIQPDAIGSAAAEYIGLHQNKYKQHNMIENNERNNCRYSNIST
jgi:hypothetical protein